MSFDYLSDIMYVMSQRYFELPISDEIIEMWPIQLLELESFSPFDGLNQQDRTTSHLNSKPVFLVQMLKLLYFINNLVHKILQIVM